MGHTTTFFDLRDAFGQRGCAVCRLALVAVNRYIESTNYEAVNDPGFRAEIEASWGFCNVHADQWLTDAHPLGTALIYERLLAQVEDALTRLHPTEPGGIFADVASLFGRHHDVDNPTPHTVLSPTGECPACRVRLETERQAIAALVEGLSDQDFSADYEASGGLCVPHLRQAFCLGLADPAFSMLRGVAVATQERLRAELREVARKHDYRFRDEPAGEEYGSVERAVRHMAAAVAIDHR
jgi:hypothetical protein